MPSLSKLLPKYIYAAFPGIWLETQEPEEAERELLQLSLTRKAGDVSPGISPEAYREWEHYLQLLIPCQSSKCWEL